MILSIDPGNTHSAYVMMRVEDYKPVRFGKLENKSLAMMLKTDPKLFAEMYVIERISCYGMAVGRDVLDTCEWIGRFSQIINDYREKPVNYLLRMDEKMEICHNSRARDSNIRRSLIDMFATNDLKNGKGTKKNPDWFYGFAADTWAAYAVAYTFVKRGLKGSDFGGE